MPGLTLDCRSSSNCSSTCGSNRHHKCIGISFAHPLRTPMKWSLKVPIGRLHKFLWWSSGGTSLYVIFDVDPSASFVDSMASFMSPLHWLLRIWCFGTIPCRRICSSMIVRAAMSAPSFWFFIGSTQKELLSTWCITIMDLFPWLEMYGKSPVWLDYIAFVSRLSSSSS